MRFPLALALSAAIATLGAAQTSPPLAHSSNQPRSDQQSRSGESSSKDSKIDLSPPKGDDIAHSDPDAEDTSGVMETKPWNPHKAAKDVEVGDFYAKRKNFRAAISRYREALEYKPKDAEATFKLAKALESDKQDAEAQQRYGEYLKILPQGEYAAESQKAIERLKQKPRS